MKAALEEISKREVGRSVCAEVANVLFEAFARSVLNPELSPPMQLAFMEGGSETAEMQANS